VPPHRANGAEGEGTRSSAPIERRQAMRKRITLMVAVVALMMAMFAPAAFASHIDVVGDENVVRTEGDDVRFNAVCQNIIGSVGDIEQTQEGEATAEAEDDSEATATVEQEQDVTIAQGNSCLNDHHHGWWHF
jgi:hypothetical protein